MKTVMVVMPTFKGIYLYMPPILVDGYGYETAKSWWLKFVRKNVMGNGEERNRQADAGRNAERPDFTMYAGGETSTSYSQYAPAMSFRDYQPNFLGFIQLWYRRTTNFQHEMFIRIGNYIA